MVPISKTLTWTLQRPDSARCLQGQQEGSELSLSDRMDVQLSVEETYADVAPIRTLGVSAAVSIMRGCDNM